MVDFAQPRFNNNQGGYGNTKTNPATGYANQNQGGFEPKSG